MESTKYIGMDVHKDAISIAVLNSSGKLVMESIIETKANTILEFVHGLRGSLDGRRSGGYSATDASRPLFCDGSPKATAGSCTATSQRMFFS
jgi:hypothetical protein